MCFPDLFPPHRLEGLERRCACSNPSAHLVMVGGISLHPSTSTDVLNQLPIVTASPLTQWTDASCTVCLEVWCADPLTSNLFIDIPSTCLLLCLSVCVHERLQVCMCVYVRFCDTIFHLSLVESLLPLGWWWWSSGLCSSTARPSVCAPMQSWLPPGVHPHMDGVPRHLPLVQTRNHHHHTVLLCHGCCRRVKPQRVSSHRNQCMCV